MKPISTFIFTEVLKELKQLEGLRLDKINQIGPEVFRFTFGKKDAIFDLGVRLNLTTYKSETPAKPSQVTMILRKLLENKKLVQLTQHTNDRIAIFDFGQCMLIGEFFSHGNLIITDEHLRILFCFRPEEWKDRKIEKGLPYEFPKNLIPQMKEDYSPLSKDFIAKFKTMNEAVDEFFAMQKEENKNLQKLGRRLEMQKKTLQNMEKEITELKEKGDLILANYELIEKAKAGKKGKLAVNI